MKNFDLLPPPRDRWGRPNIDGTYFTRASTLAKALDDTTNLARWQQRQVLIGVGKSPDLVAAAATAKPDDKKLLARLAEQAMERAESSASASIGTAIHAATELLDHNEPTNHLPAEIIADATAYRTAVEGASLTPELGELFVANTEINAAGTFDRLVRGPGGGFAILDIKTQKPSDYDPVKYSGLAWAVQLAVYANSTPYCSDRGFLDWRELGVAPPSKEFGVVAHITQGTASAHLYLLDLVAGWEYARLATAVRTARKQGPKLASPL